MVYTASQSEPSEPPESGPRPFSGTTRAQLSASELQAALARSVCHGARSARIGHYVPELVDILYPDGELNADHLTAVEDTIRAALDSIGGTDAAALAQLLGLESGIGGDCLDHRRAVAARTLGITPDTLRRTRQRALLWDLAMEIYHAHPE
ncbi:MAG: hypothetical protein J2P17_18240 [Mycobacterium sp.]|nr:hypothetical protein [Mycobacterium sp.]